MRTILPHRRWRPKGLRVAVVTMKDGTGINVSGLLRDFDGFVSTLRASAELPVPNNR
jgi:hypothetical protein